MIDFEIRRVKPEAMVPVQSEEADRKRLKEIRTRLGQAAFIKAFGEKRTIARVSEGIKRSQGALKWIADLLKEE